MSTINTDKIATRNLIFYLDAANRNSYLSGTTWTDLTQNRRNGTLTNGPTFSSQNAGYFTFDGVNDYTDFGNTSLDIAAGATGLTLEAWVYPVTFASYGGIISRVGGVSPFGGWMLNVNSDGSVNKFDLAINISGNWRTWVTGGGTFGGSLSTSRWYHVVSTYNGSTLEMYLNGTKYNSISYSGTIQYASVNNLYVGLNGGGAYFNGRISNVKVYNRDLTQSEVTSNFNAHRARYGI